MQCQYLSRVHKLCETRARSLRRSSTFSFLGPSPDSRLPERSAGLSVARPDASRSLPARFSLSCGSLLSLKVLGLGFISRFIHKISRMLLTLLVALVIVALCYWVFGHKLSFTQRSEGLYWLNPCSRCKNPSKISQSLSDLCD